MAWIPAANVRRLTASEWDTIEFHQCPPRYAPSAGRSGCPASYPNRSVARLMGVKAGHLPKPQKACVNYGNGSTGLYARQIKETSR